MGLYFNKIPKVLKWVYPSAIWHFDTDEKVIYLTFDDGPEDGVTDFVLNESEKFNAKATFFCLGEKIIVNQRLFGEIIQNGHTVANHSFSHLNGLKNEDKEYIEDIYKADKLIKSIFFRPPYGAIGPNQFKELSKKFKIVMWDVMPGDFDSGVDGERCFLNTIENTREGSIVVLHDSEKAFPKLKVALPKILKHYTDLGYRFEKF